MAEPGWPRHALSVGVFEFRWSVRAMWQDKARFAFMALGMLIFPVILTVLVVVFADAIRSVETLPVPDRIRGTVALFCLFGVFMIGQRVVSARPRIEAEPLMLTTVSARTVAGGLLVAETLRGLAYLGLPALVLTGAGVYLFGSPASLIMVPAAALLFTATAVVTGAVVGYAVAWLVATSRFVARHKTILGTAASLIGMGGYFLFFFPQIGGVSQAALAWLPMGWFADLAVVGTGLLESPLRAVGVLVGSAVLLLGGGALVERETVALWFTEPVSVETGDTVRESATVGGEQSPPSRRDALATAVKPLGVPRVVPTPIRRVAEWTLLRTRRDPNRLTFLLIPVFAIGSSPVGTGLQSGSLRALAAPVCVVLLPWLSGALFAMNPLGDEGAVLPVTLTAISGKQYVRGLMVPGLVLGLPVVVIVTSVAGVLSPYTVTEQVSLVVLGVYLTCVSVAITPAVGMALPRFSAISVGQSREVLPPRMSAAFLHLALIMVPGALLTMLVIIPRIARGVLAVLFGSLPAFLLGLLTDAAGGPLSTAAA
jgi:ABC-2 type transport system permease protein